MVPMDLVRMEVPEEVADHLPAQVPLEQMLQEQQKVPRLQAAGMAQTEVEMLQMEMLEQSQVAVVAVLVTLVLVR